eukprot:TRINITY_DN8885_c0_g1_i5.p1 TRINITY_DN8885_c0_g1~~TRINITY_DN8885_c0_g1_i5.p1  ORF type:complete len:201 (-),score=-6.29 TRINITY_DN8885_c0_g1_i5:17-619(-)
MTLCFFSENIKQFLNCSFQVFLQLRNTFYILFSYFNQCYLLVCIRTSPIFTKVFTRYEISILYLFLRNIVIIQKDVCQNQVLFFFLFFSLRCNFQQVIFHYGYEKIREYKIDYLVVEFFRIVCFRSCLKKCMKLQDLGFCIFSFFFFYCISKGIRQTYQVDIISIFYQIVGLYMFNVNGSSWCDLWQKELLSLTFEQEGV